MARPMKKYIQPQRVHKGELVGKRVDIHHIVWGDVGAVVVEQYDDGSLKVFTATRIHCMVRPDEYRLSLFEDVVMLVEEEEPEEHWPSDGPVDDNFEEHCKKFDYPE